MVGSARENQRREVRVNQNQEGSHKHRGSDERTPERVQLVFELQPKTKIR